MLTYGEASYSYGKRGDLQRKIVGTDTTTYNYDNRGNLRSVTLPGGKQIEYLIDGQDRRVAKKVNGQVTTRWLYASGLLPIAVLDSTGSVEKRYGPGYVVKNDTTYRVVRDHLGSVRMVVNNQTGQVVQRIDYDAWGNITHLQNENEFTDIGFAGGLYDHDTGLVRFGARDYDPQTGR
jgi:YD repeat-containing protein